MDEPTVGIDPQSRNNILEGIKKLNQQGATIIYTSHYMEEVEQLCDYILIIDRGKTIAEGSKEKLKAMISLGEIIEIELEDIKKSTVEVIKNLNNVISVEVKNKLLVVRSGKGKNQYTRGIENIEREQSGI